MILIVTNKRDVSADFVVRELQQRGLSYRRINTEDLVQAGCSCDFAPFDWEIQSPSKSSFRLEQVRVVWFRRPGNPFQETANEQKPSVSVQRYVTEQWATWIEALELSPQCRWVNPPTAAAQFENKIRQLKLARELGFSIPESLVSNDPVRIRAFAKNRTLVAKALFAPLIEGETEDQFIFAETVTAADLNDDAAMRAAPTIFQEAILPKHDYRVTVVGNRLFAVRIDLPKGALDWRIHRENVQFVQVSLPPAVEHLCFHFVERAGLVFGAIDLVERDGTWYFLEINPSGEWGWLQQPVGLPIAEALCDVFTALAANTP